MTEEQIDYMFVMHRYLMKCEIKHAFDKFSALNGNEDYSAASLSEAFNDTKWNDFAKWLKGDKR
jgi:hypothetical protein